MAASVLAASGGQPAGIKPHEHPEEKHVMSNLSAQYEEDKKRLLVAALAVGDYRAAVRGLSGLVVAGHDDFAAELLKTLVEAAVQSRQVTVRQNIDTVSQGTVVGYQADRL